MACRPSSMVCARQSRSIVLDLVPGIPFSQRGRFLHTQLVNMGIGEIFNLTAVAACVFL